MDLEQAVFLTCSLARRFEGLSLRPYLDSVGVATIGRGATFYRDGTRVSLTDPAITEAEADALLEWHVRNHFILRTLKLCPGADTPPRLAALCDFAFNLGLGNLSASTLRRKVNAGEWGEVAGQFMRWNKAGGKELRGLTRRRAAEASLCG